MSTMLLEIVTPQERVYSKEVQQVVARAETGDIGILPRHTPLVATLAPGVLRVVDESGERHVFAVTGGFLEVTPEKVTVLARTVEAPEEINVERAQAAKKRAEERLARRHEDEIDYVRAQAALQRAVARLRAVDEVKSAQDIR